MVYIVEDDPTVCDALSSLLRASGKNVRMFSSGAEFLSFERRGAGACLILDLRMPGMNGLEGSETHFESSINSSYLHYRTG
nr:response regulator [Edaphobacter aggregans]